MASQSAPNIRVSAFRKLVPFLVLAAVALVAVVVLLLVTNREPPFVREANPFRAGTQTKVTPAGSFKAPGVIERMAYSSRHDLLFLQALDSVWVVDGKSDAVISTLPSKTYLPPAAVPGPRHRGPQPGFSDMDLSPLENFLYVADYDMEIIGHGQPARPHYVHRFDLARKTWTPLGVPGIAYRLEALDEDHVLLLAADQHVDLTLNRWDGGAMKELHRLKAGHGGDIRAGAATPRFFYANLSREVAAWQVVDGKLTRVQEVRIPGGAKGDANPAGAADTFALSVDGSRLYYGNLQVDADQINRQVREFPESIISGSRDLAFGAKNYYNATTGERVGALEFTSKVHAFSAAGLKFFAYDPASKMMHKFVLEGER